MSLPATPQSSDPTPTSMKLTFEPKLSGQETFFQWKFMLKIILLASNLWDFELNIPKNEPSALLAITANITEGVRSFLIDATTAQQCWIILKNKYACKSIPTQIQTIKELCSFSFTSGDFQNGFTKLRDLLRTFKAANEDGDTINFSTLVALIALSALPSDFSSIRTVLENAATDDPSLLHLDQLEPKFLLEEIAHHPKQLNSTALSAQTKKNESRCSHNRNPSSCWTCHPELAPICELCRSQGLRRFKHKPHSRICPQPKNGDHANVAFIANKPSADRQTWILDSGATQHMCHDPNLFTAISPFHATITTANGKPMHSKGTGTVFYKYGSSSITLNNTLFCPELQQNLISIRLPLMWVI
jgi:hypothetical protein